MVCRTNWSCLTSSPNLKMVKYLDWVATVTLVEALICLEAAATDFPLAPETMYMGEMLNICKEETPKIFEQKVPTLLAKNTTMHH